MKKKYTAIDEVSSSFCLAKWLQVTIDLENGTTHSCHHPRRHKISIKDLDGNPSALHNTQFKKKQRKLMLEGVRPKECSYCWRMEDLGYISDRYIKSTDPWAYKYLHHIATAPWDQDINPTYLEVMFDKTCQLSCAYCSADVSSSIASEFDRFGTYRVFNKRHRAKKFSNRNKEKYHAAFWKWIPEVITNLEELRITGGEPFLTSHLGRLLDLIEQFGHHNLRLAINSNFSIPQELVQKFLQRINKLYSMKKISTLELYVSIDTWGKDAEYIREGLDFSLFLDNIEYFLQHRKNYKLIFVVTFNLLSVAKFQQLLEYILQQKYKYGLVLLDCAYLLDPTYLAANLLPVEFYNTLDECLLYLQQHVSKDMNNGFLLYEYQKVERIFSWIKQSKLDDPDRSYMDFYFFIREYDRRYNKNFLDIFPQMSEFLQKCKEDVYQYKFRNMRCTSRDIIQKK